MKYQIILADPPWHYNDRRNTSTRFCGGAMRHYDVIRIEELKKLPIQNICDNNCMLFLWATFPNLLDALDLMKAWGFKYKTIGFLWVKLNKKNNKPFFGIGYYSASNSEPCLIGVKGKPFKHDKKESSIILSPRENHSKKPEGIRNRINLMYPNLSKIELFARKESFQQYIEGWYATGLEYDNMLIQDFLLNASSQNEIFSCHK